MEKKCIIEKIAVGWAIRSIVVIDGVEVYTSSIYCDKWTKTPTSVECMDGGLLVGVVYCDYVRVRA